MDFFFVSCCCHYRFFSITEIVVDLFFLNLPFQKKNSLLTIIIKISSIKSKNVIEYRFILEFQKQNFLQINEHKYNGHWSL